MSVLDDILQDGRLSALLKALLLKIAVISWVLVGCRPLRPSAPSPPLGPGEMARAQHSEGRCFGEPERLSCDISSHVQTETGRERRRKTRLNTRPAEVELLAAVPPPIARHPLMARAFGHRPCRFRSSGCVHRFGVGLVERAHRSDGFEHRLELVAPPGFDMEASPASGEPQLEVRMRSRPRHLSPGGPVLALGKVFGAVPRRGIGASREAGLVGRVGWEAFAPARVGHALSVDVTTGGAVTLAYLPQVMTSRWLVLPSLGIGIGLPVQLAPRLTSGLRVQASVAFPVIGLVGWVDLMAPVDLARDQPARGHLALQVAL